MVFGARDRRLDRFDLSLQIVAQLAVEVLTSHVGHRLNESDATCKCAAFIRGCFVSERA